MTFIVNIAACTSHGDWLATWRSLLAGKPVLVNTGSLAGQGAVAIPVAAVASLDRALSADATGPAVRLARTVADALDAPRDAAWYIGSNHGEAELVRALLRELTKPEAQAVLYDEILSLDAARAFRLYSACTSGLSVLAAAVFDLDDGLHDDAAVLAVDALSAIETIGFARSGALSGDRAWPFLNSRAGLTIGEGAVAVRLARVAAGASTKVLGIGLGCDAHHPTDPHPDGRGTDLAIQAALTQAGLAPSNVAAIVAHGTGTPKGDEAELRAIMSVWCGDPPPVTSVKGCAGHLMGASGLLNLAVAHESSRTGLLPPINSAGTAAGIAPCVVVDQPMQIVPGAPVLAIASGFGGNTVAVVVAAR